MKGKKTFLDTNILVYAVDSSDLRKQQTAKQCIKDAGLLNSGVVSTQVLQGFYNAAVNKIGLEPLAAKDLLRFFRRFETVIISPDMIADAIDCSILNRLSFWDSLIIIAAESAGCEVLLTEDLRNGQSIHGVRTLNPFIK
jgi:predicted nucleic acid-binding protein